MAGKARRPTVKQIDRFFAVFRPLVETGLEAMGATRGARFGYTHTLPTRYGPLWIKVTGGERFLGGKPSDLGGIHARFETASQGLPAGANPYSGKWNHYFDMESHTPEEAAVYVLGMLNSVALQPNWPKHGDKHRQRAPASDLRWFVFRRERDGKFYRFDEDNGREGRGFASEAQAKEAAHGQEKFDGFRREVQWTSSKGPLRRYKPKYTRTG
jgi:hypothetical protein